MPVLGPGTLKIGPAGSEIDASCLLNNARITSDADEGDSKTMLCGTVKPGKTTFTYQLTGSVDTDTDVPDGLFALSQAQPGSQQPFEFVPSTETGTAAKGVLIITPLDFGADEYGDWLDSDFEWTLVGKPEYTFPTAGTLTTHAQRLVVNGTTAPGAKEQAYDVDAPPAGAETTKAKTKAA